MAAFVGHRLERGPAARAALRPLALELLTGYPVPVRCALAAVLAEPGSGDSAPLRRELLEVLLAREAWYAETATHGAYTDPGTGRDTRVLEALLRVAAEGAGGRPEERTRELVHRAGTLLARTPEGAACFDRQLAELGRRVPGFARRVQGWVAAEPGSGRRWWGPAPEPRSPAAREAEERPGTGPRPRPAAVHRRPPGAPFAQSTTRGMAVLDLRHADVAQWTDESSGEERAQCSAGVAWRTSPRVGDAASSPSARTTECTAATN
ncbi:hypothetical protein PQR15_09095 [Streptomyces lydicus]|nr:hypothetical protein [Streptomyces lydicus]